MKIFSDYGYEENPHITVAYGLDPAMDRQRIADLVASIGKPVRVRLGKISKFEPDKYDVIKVEVDSDDLHALHEVVKALGVPGETYPEYKPHLTLAYVQKGAADHLLGQTPFEGQEFELTGFDYSAPPAPGEKDKHTKYEVGTKVRAAGSDIDHWYDPEQGLIELDSPGQIHEDWAYEHQDRAGHELIVDGWARVKHRKDVLYVDTFEGNVAAVLKGIAKEKPEFLLVQTLVIDSFKKSIEVPVLEGEDAEIAWSRRKDIRHRVKAAGGYARHLWVSPTGEIEDCFDANHGPASIGILSRRGVKPVGKQEDDEEGEWSMAQLFKDGWVRVLWTPSELNLNNYTMSNEALTGYIKFLPAEMLFPHKFLVVNDEDVVVLEGEDALDAWSHRKDVRHRVTASGATIRFFVSPSGVIYLGEPGEEHTDILDYIGGRDTQVADVVLVSEDPIETALSLGWVRGGFDGSHLYMSGGKGAKTIESILKKLPTRFLLARTLLFEPDDGSGGYDIPVLEGEDALDAWRHRNDIRHRVSAATTRDSGSFWMSPSGELFDSYGEHDDSIMKMSKDIFDKYWKKRRSGNVGFAPRDVAIENGWVRLGVNGNEIFMETEKSPEWVLSLLPMEMRVSVNSLTIDSESQGNWSLAVLEDEDALDAWTHRKDIRHRVSGTLIFSERNLDLEEDVDTLDGSVRAGGDTSFWITPKGIFEFDEYAEHMEYAEKLAPRIFNSIYNNRRPKDEDGEDTKARFFDALTEAGYVRGIADPKELSIGTFNDDKVQKYLELVQKHNPAWLFVKTVASDKTVIPVLEGEDALDAWKHRNDIRHRIAAGISPVVYHATWPSNAASILQDDEFRLSVAQGSDAKALGIPMPKDKFYYLSTARSRTGGYAKDPYRSATTLELDGTALANRYSGDSVDYWGPDFRGVDPSKFEKEDRIWSKESTIPEASKYIKAVLAFFDPKTVDDNDKRSMRALAIAAKTKGIPFRLYVDKSSYVADNEAKAVPVTDLDLKTAPKESGRSYGPLPAERLEGLVELFRAPAGSKLTPKADKVRYEIVYSEYALEQFISRAEIDLHNSRKNGKADSLVKSMRDAKAADLRSFVKTVASKWRVPEAVAASAWSDFEAYAVEHLGIPFRAQRIFAGTVFGDRYQALGIPYPDPKTMCGGQCEGTGLIPVNFREPAPGAAYFVYSDEDDALYRPLWEAAEAKAPSEDGYHFIRCQDCGGTGKIVAGDKTIAVDDGEDAQTAWDHRNSVRKRVVAGVADKVEYLDMLRLMESGRMNPMVFEHKAKEFAVGKNDTVSRLINSGYDHRKVVNFLRVLRDDPKGGFIDFIAEIKAGSANIKFWIDPAGKFRGFGGASEYMDNIAHLEWLAQNKVAYTVTDDSAFGELPAKGWVRGYVQDGSLTITIDPAATSVLKALGSIPQEYRFVDDVFVEGVLDADGNSEDIGAVPVLEGEDAIDAWRHRKDARHRMTGVQGGLMARQTGIRFWISPDGELHSWESDTAEDPWDDMGETSHGFMLYSEFPDFEDEHRDELDQDESTDVAHIAIKHGYTRGIFANNELNIELGNGKSVDWALSKLPSEYLLVKVLNVEDQAEVPVLEGEDAEAAWTHRKDVRHRVTAENKFDRLYREAVEVSQNDAKYSGALENPSLAQEMGAFQQKIKDSRSEQELRSVWEEFEPSITWETLVAIAGENE